MNKIVSSLVAAAAAVAVMGGANDGSAADYKIKIQVQTPAAAPVNKFLLVPFAKKVEEESGGRIDVQVFHSMGLGGRPPQVFDQTKDGIAEIGWTLPGYSGGRFPLTTVFELPFMVTTGDATTQAFQEFAEKRLMDEYKDVHPLLFHTAARFKIHMVKSPITKVSDFNGRKVRATNRAMGDFLKLLGATPVHMPVPAVPQALSKKVVEGAVLPWEIVIPFKIQELAPYHSLIEGRNGFIAATFLMAMNKKAYNELPADLKAVIDRNSGMNTAKWIGKVYDDVEGKFRAIAEKRGNTFTVIPPAEVAKMQAAAERVQQAWVADVTEKGHDGQALLAEAKATIAKYTK
jgi:TRAP-type C4-dicarboxylate transport system substrate-binding protein